MREKLENNCYYFLSKVLFVNSIQFKLLGRRGDRRPKTGNQKHRDRERSKHKSSHRGSHGGSPSKSSSRQRYKLLSCP